MSLPEHVCNRLKGLGLDCSVEGGEVHVQATPRVTKIRFDDEWTDAWATYKKARSRTYESDARTLLFNNSVEVQLTRLASPSVLAPDQYNLSDRNGNTVVISTASHAFSLAFFETEDYAKYFEARVKRRLLDSPISTRRMIHLLWSPTTATYTEKGRKTPPDLKDKALSSIKNSLFKIAVEQHECFSVWKGRSRRLKLSHPEVQTDDHSIPRSSYDENVVSYYKVAKASPFPSQSFLAYYHVLEYYFLRVSEMLLHDRLTAMLNDPRFHASRDSLDRLISTVRGQDARNDETEMLRNVLDRFVQESELIEFVQKLEDACGEKIYTKKRHVFGEQLQITPMKDHALANAAKTLKHVRNAIVHSSDRYKRDERHVPLSDSEDLIEEFIPLVRFFAEKVIYGTAT